MRVARTQKDLPHKNTLVLRKLKVYFQRYPGKGGADADRGIADVEYTLKVAGRVVDKGKTAADGAITMQVPAGQKVELTLLGTTYEVAIRSSLEKDDTKLGKQRRLTLLGYELGDVDGNWGKRSDHAALTFQADQGLDPDGDVGTNTRAKLRSEFGE